MDRKFYGLIMSDYKVITTNLGQVPGSDLKLLRVFRPLLALHASESCRL